MRTKGTATTTERSRLRDNPRLNAATQRADRCVPALITWNASYHNLPIVVDSSRSLSPM